MGKMTFFTSSAEGTPRRGARTRQKADAPATAVLLPPNNLAIQSEQELGLEKYSIQWT